MTHELSSRWPGIVPRRFFGTIASLAFPVALVIFVIRNGGFSWFGFLVVGAAVYAVVIVAVVGGIGALALTVLRSRLRPRWRIFVATIAPWLASATPLVLFINWDSPQTAPAIGGMTGIGLVAATATALFGVKEWVTVEIARIDV